ncbi:hypothetical protein [Paraburkholderia sp. J76]|uniref:hypothetical protein n=1 Tax=Paraburkholderia sp. J76 TaxID=2805439 RepID=UPI002ABE6B91|nr:hypothetical protein [Paraburkholderia sp. J76]
MDGTLTIADDVAPKANRWRRLAVRRGEFLSADAFCRRRAISPAELQRLERRGDAFSLEIIAHKRYYPAVLASVRGVRRLRLDRLCRLLKSIPEESMRLDALTAARIPLGNRSVMRSLSMGVAYRRARWFVEATVREYT